MSDYITKSDIRKGCIYTNGNGLFRLVTAVETSGVVGVSWVDVTYSAYRRRKDGRMVMATVRGRHADLISGIGSFTAWARREATEAEAAEVRGV